MGRSPRYKNLKENVTSHQNLAYPYTMKNIDPSLRKQIFEPGSDLKCFGPHVPWPNA